MIVRRKEEGEGGGEEGLASGEGAKRTEKPESGGKREDARGRRAGEGWAGGREEKRGEEGGLRRGSRAWSRVSFVLEPRISDFEL